HDHEMRQSQHNGRSHINALRDGLSKRATKTAGAHNNDDGRLYLHGYRLKARTIFKKPFPSFQLFDVGSYISYLSLYLKGICNLAGLFQDLHKLQLKRLLRLDASLQIYEFFGDIVT